MKKIITAVLLLISFASFGQSGVDSTTINTSTPMAAKQYQFKYLKVDSGLSVRKRFFAKDSAFFSGRTYTSVLPASDDSSNQVPNTNWVKARIGIKVDSVTKNTTADSIYSWANGVIIKRIKDSIGTGSFARDTIVAGRGLFATTINANKVQLDNDSAVYIITQINDTTLSFTHFDGRIDTVTIVSSGGGGGGTLGIDDVLAQVQVLTANRGIDLGGTNVLQIFSNAFPNIVAEFNSDGALITSPDFARSYQAGDSLYAVTNHTSSDTSKYKPFGISPDGGAVRMNSWPVGAGGVYLPLAGGTLTGNLLFTDNTYDIGASGATRPRTGYYGTSVMSPTIVGGTTTTSPLTLYATTGVAAAGASILFKGGTNGGTTFTTMNSSGNWDYGSSTLTTTGNITGFNWLGSGFVRAAAASYIGWNGRATFYSSADGVIDARNNANSQYASIQTLYDRFGSGSPESVVTAPVGAVYHRTDGGAGTSLYVKESGTGNTGWVAK